MSTTPSAEAAAPGSAAGPGSTVKFTVAEFVTAQEDGPAPRLRGDFTLEAGHGEVTAAVLRATALGVYEATLDGVSVSEDVLSPGWSSYEWRLKVQTYDITALLSGAAERSEHTLAALVGNGWYRGQLGWQERFKLYGEDRAFAAELAITYDDGHVQLIFTGGDWVSQPSEILVDDLYDGQVIDARLANQTWARPPAQRTDADGTWAPVRTVTTDAELVEPIGPPVRRQEILRPRKIWTSPSGKTLVDFEQNLVGWLRFTVTGPAGEEIILRHAEVLEHEELGTRPLRHADATDRLILSGGEDRFEPRFTFHGFRYAEVTGWPTETAGELTVDSVEAVVVHSEMRRAGTFRSSNELLNQLHSNIVWGQKGNFLEVPTDCPQRDERLGWTGDIAVFAPAAAFLYDVRPFLADWLADVDAEQSHAEGMVPFVVPDVLKYQDLPKEFPSPETAAIWSDAAVWVPAALYRAYGDEQILTDQYSSMVAHIRRTASLLSETGLWDSGFQFGDWLDPDASPHEPANAKAHPGVVATACAARSARMVSEFAEILGHHKDAAEFKELADRVQAAFQQHYVGQKGFITSDCTTVYTLAIVFDLLNEQQRASAGKRLAELVQEAEYKVSTGFAGTPYITDALSQTGHISDAYQLLLETGCPSWLYPVTMGATTVWERWDSMLPDGSINPGEMTSFNHYALGSVADWMHRIIGGIQPAAPGYSAVRIAPVPPTGPAADELTWAEATLSTTYGRISSRWSRDGDTVTLTAEVPEGVTAELALPGAQPHQAGPGTHTLIAAASA